MVIKANIRKFNLGQLIEYYDFKKDPIKDYFLEKM